MKRILDRATDPSSDWSARPENAALAAAIWPHVTGEDGGLDRAALFRLAEINGLGDLSGVYGTLGAGQLLVTIGNRLKPLLARGELQVPRVPGDAVFHMAPGAPPPVAPFSHAVEAGGLVVLSGQMPNDPAAPEAALPAGVAAQTDAVMANLSAVLGDLGLDLGHLIQCRAYLTAFERDYTAFNAAYAAHFDADARPARTTVGVTALALGALVEIDAVARRP